MPLEKGMVRKGVDWEVFFFLFFSFLVIKGRDDLKKTSGRGETLQRTKEISGS